MDVGGGSGQSACCSFEPEDIQVLEVETTLRRCDARCPRPGPARAVRRRLSPASPHRWGIARRKGTLTVGAEGGLAPQHAAH